ncbi:hypothetical protein AVEN_62955-1 [Araneus ventricosus]|uniref:Uncharacterized protein n=1 Tax=Araneus ventricosus TaxID=182803 RepID=A0A4Y2TGJ4_ARAVE|nr:hypothetical protein AVEN_62955-1 [Araneus ventricosus]
MGGLYMPFQKQRKPSSSVGNPLRTFWVYNFWNREAHPQFTCHFRTEKPITLHTVGIRETILGFTCRFGMRAIWFHAVSAERSPSWVNMPFQHKNPSWVYMPFSK